MQRRAAEWSIRPSQRQRSLDLAAAGVLLLIIGLLAPEFLLLAVPLFSLVLIRHHELTHIGVNDDGWWIGGGKGRRPVTWRSGSQRKPDHLFLVWGFWPWQTLHLNADSMANADDFRRLKMALYGSL